MRAELCGKVVVRRRVKGVSTGELGVEMIRRHSQRCDRVVHSGGRRSDRFEETGELEDEVNTTMERSGETKEAHLIQFSILYCHPDYVLELI